MKNIILLSSEAEKPIDEEHRFVCLGPNCWGISGTSAKEAFDHCRINAPRSSQHFLTRVVHKSVQVDPVDGALSWDSSHDAKTCRYCTAGKGIQVQVE